MHPSEVQSFFWNLSPIWASQYFSDATVSLKIRVVTREVKTEVKLNTSSAFWCDLNPSWVGQICPQIWTDGTMDIFSTNDPDQLWTLTQDLWPELETVWRRSQILSTSTTSHLSHSPIATTNGLCIPETRQESCVS